MRGLGLQGGTLKPSKGGGAGFTAFYYRAGSKKIQSLIQKI